MWPLKATLGGRKILYILQSDICDFDFLAYFLQERIMIKRILMFYIVLSCFLV